MKVSTAVVCRRGSRSWWAGLLAGLALLGTASPWAVAAGDEAASPDRLGELLALDIAELMDVPVSLVSRQEESQFSAPAAAYVITAEDIRRSGLRRIPELLRLVPGLHVSKLDANTWAISSRSQMTRFSDTMLVLMDGRTLYTPLFAGVYWDVQDTLIEDIERIEVIRGPGATLWGANAVTGVINIVTKRAQDTQGGLAYGGAGQGEMKAEGGLRYGTKLGERGHGRVYAKGYQTDSGEHLSVSESTNNGFFPVGAEADDDGRFAQTGFRYDQQDTGNGTLTLQGDYYDGSFDNIRRKTFPLSALPNTVDARGANLMARWSQNLSADSALSVQGYYDHTERVDDSFDDERNIADLEFQHSFSLPRQQIIWGGGYRRIHDDTAKTPTGTFTLVPASRTDNLTNVFIQDRISLIDDRLFAIAGTKLEDNDYTGHEYEPNARLLWTPNVRQTLWLSGARAVRMPTRADFDATLDLGFVQIPIGDPDTESFVVKAWELGYRQLLTNEAMIDIALFDNHYEDTFQPAVDPNPAGAITETHGAEVVARFRTAKNHRLEAWYVWQRGFEFNASGEEVDSNAIPRHSAHLRSYWDATPAFSVDTLLYFVDDIPGVTRTIPDYLRLDMRFAWRFRRGVETSLLFTNLLDSVHPETASETTRVNTGVTRGAFLKLEYAW